MPASYKVEIHMHKGSVPFQNDLYFWRDGGDATYEEAVLVADAVVNAGILDALRDCLPTDVTCDGVVVRSVIADGGSTVATPPAILASGAVGTRSPGTGGQTSNQNGPLLTWNPLPEAGERIRTGKMFLPTINEVDAEDDVVQASLLTSLSSLKALLVAGLDLSGTALSWVACIFKQLAPPPEAKTRIIRAIVRSFVEGFVASQRRRRPKNTTF
jgi:hypothetical protein